MAELFCRPTPKFYVPSVDCSESKVLTPLVAGPSLCVIALELLSDDTQAGALPPRLSMLHDAKLLSELIDIPPWNEERGVSFYLSNGWPLHAFHCALENLSEGIGVDPDDTRSLLHIHAKRAFDDNEKNILIDFARTAAFQNLFNSKTLSACTCFLDLCRLERERESLRVDFEAAGRIEKWLKGKGKDLDHEVVSIFLDFPKSASVNKALALLGEATRDLTGPDQSNRKGAMAWKLVSSFCRVHELKTSIALLQELLAETILLPFFTRQKGRNSQGTCCYYWKREFFKSSAWRACEQVACVICSSSTSILSEKIASKLENTCKQDSEILAGSRHDVKSLAKQLLLLALTEKMSMYAITAASLPNVRADLALLVWLHIQTQEEGNPTPQLSTQLFSIVNNGVDGVTHQLGEEEMMLHMIGTFYSGHTLPTLLLGLDLFWPESALAIIVRFVQACHFAKFDQARNYARQSRHAICSSRSMSRSPRSYLESSEWLEKIMRNLAERMLDVDHVCTTTETLVSIGRMAVDLHPKPNSNSHGNEGEEYDVSYDTVTLERTVDEALPKQI